MKKKLLYIFFGGSDNMSSGVMKKIHNKIRVLNELNFTTDGVSFTDKIEEEIQLSNHIRLIPIKKTNSNLFKTTRTRVKTYDELASFLRNNISKYENVIFRYPLASFRLLQIVNEFPNRITFEHNTKEVEEIRSNWYNSELLKSSKLKLSFYLSTLEAFLLPYLKEKYLAKYIYSKAKFGISVTKEIANFKQSQCKGYTNYVLSNSFNVRTVEPISHKNSKPYNLVMLIGGFGNWHGEDRLLNGLANCKYHNDFKITLVGVVQKSTLELISSLNLENNVEVIPLAFGDELDLIMNSATIAVGSLAIHRKELCEASPLKTREYFARGIPSILGYQDTDVLENKNLQKYCLQVPSNDSPIDFDSIKEFVNKMSLITNVENKIRNLALETVDTPVKMKHLIQFFNVSNY